MTVLYLAPRVEISRRAEGSRAHRINLNEKKIARTGAQDISGAAEHNQVQAGTA